MYLLIGSGQMAKEYVKPLVGQNIDFIVIGRAKSSSKNFENETGVPVVSGGVEAFLESNKKPIEGAIVAVGVDCLCSVTMQLLANGITKILLEKPAGLDVGEIETLTISASEKDAKVFVAYNRRFFCSVLKAKEIILMDGGVTSFNFELTEWAHVIEKLKKSERIKQAWFLANTTHVADLAYFLGGKPVEMKTFVNEPLDWHPAGSVFTGAGISNTGALFSYSGNWQAPGRWALEVMTCKSRLIFKPMEELYIQKIGSVKQEKVEIDYSLDENYKPGLYLQLKAFFQENYDDLCSIEEQLSSAIRYSEMAGY